VLHYSGLPLTAHYVVDAVMSVVQEQTPIAALRGSRSPGAKP
jgi:hypothetical protein